MTQQRIGCLEETRRGALGVDRGMHQSRNLAIALPRWVARIDAASESGLNLERFPLGWSESKLWKPQLSGLYVGGRRMHGIFLWHGALTVPILGVQRSCDNTCSLREAALLKWWWDPFGWGVVKHLECSMWIGILKNRPREVFQISDF